MNERPRASGDDKLVNQIRRVNVILLFVVATLVAGPAAVTWWISRNIPSVSTVTIANLAIVGPSALCPGDKLTWHYDFEAQGSGNLVDEATIWQETPPRTVVYSQNKSFVLTDGIQANWTEAMHIPVTYINPATDEFEVLPAGKYSLIFSIASPTKSTIIAIDSAPFEIRDDCP